MSLVDLYNSLPDVQTASDAFTDRDAIFAKLAPLFAAYQFQFGVCLVHAHCALKEGEAMVASGNVSRPVYGGPQFPERWLADGTPYEFNEEPTQTPPPELIREFHAIVGKNTTLGLFYAARDQDGKVVPDGKIWLERTKGRDNVLELADIDNVPPNLGTGWIPGSDAPLTMVCHWVCVQDPQAGHVADHKNGRRG